MLLPGYQPLPMVSMRLLPPILLTAVLAVAAGSSSAEAGCRFLMPLGGSGEPVVSKRTGRKFGPFKAVPGKRTNLMNFRVGSTTRPAAVGFSYRISVQGCD